MCHKKYWTKVLLKNFKDIHGQRSQYKIYFFKCVNPVKSQVRHVPLCMNFDSLL